MTILVTKTNNSNIYNYRRTIQNCSKETERGDGDASSAIPDTPSAVLAVTNECEPDLVASQLIQAKHNPQIVDLSFHRTDITRHTVRALQTLVFERAQQQQAAPSPPWHAISLINCGGQIQEAVDLILSLDCFQSLYLGLDASDDAPVPSPDVAARRNGQRDRALGTNAESPVLPPCNIAALQTLADSLASVTRLKSLRITAVMHAGDVRVLGDAIGSNRSLTMLDLRWSCFVEPDTRTVNRSRHAPDGAVCNEQDDSIIHYLARGFRRNTSLRTLDLYGCNLNDHQMTIILHSLVQHPALQSLALNDNKCGRKASLAASHVLGHPHCQVQQFDFSFQRVGDNGGSAASRNATALTSTVVPAPSSRLNIQAIANAIQVNPSSLLSLDLSSCDLVDSDAIHLAQAIRCHRSCRPCDPSSTPALQQLVLSRNKITNIGIQALAAALRYSYSEDNVDTASNGGGGGHAAVLEPIDSVRFLEHFSKQFHRCQRCRGGLRRLSVWGNPFDEEGAQALLLALRGNTELETLDLFREFKCSAQIRHLLNMNRVGRRFLRQTNDGRFIYQDRAAVDVPDGLWAHILARSNTVKLVPRPARDEQKERAYIMFDFLRESPHLYKNMQRKGARLKTSLSP